MGRGRAKAKQTKVARELKYNAPQTDLEALQAELSRAEKRDNSGVPADDEDDRPGGYRDDGRSHS